ncbi:MAG: SIR2 family protein [Promethearchaeota archaeon]
MSQEMLFEKDGRSLEDLFIKEDNYTFLVGAGVSMNAPSNLPSAVKIVNNLISLCAPEEEVQELQRLDDLRYEWLVEAIQEHIDKEFKFLDFFDYKTTPNLLHIFLAKQIEKGNYVVTTNFDYMIEYALKRVILEGDHSKIIPIITKEDFIKYPDPQTLIDEGKYPLYKIHGAKKNLITKEDTADSLVTTQRALGKHRVEGETFSVETFKKPAVHNLLKNRNLIVMGYSGSDDFDIGPILKEIPDLKKLIWIDHSFTEIPTINKVNKVNDPKIWENELKVDQFLAEIRSDVNFKVFKVQGNTQDMVEKILWSSFFPNILVPSLSTSGDDIKFEDWIKPHYSDVDIAQKYLFACYVLSESQKNDSLQRCAEKALTIESIKTNETHSAYLLSMIALAHVSKFDYQKATEYYLQALEKFKQTNNYEETARILISLAMISDAMGREDFTQQYADQALPIAQRESMHIGLANLYTTLANKYNKQRDYDKAIMYLEKSNKEAQEAGIIMIRARNLQGIGSMYMNKGEIDKAISKLEESLRIFKEFKSAIPDVYVNLALIYDQHKNDPEKAIEYLKEITKIAHKFKGRTLLSLVPALYNISRLHLRLNDKENAFNYSIQGIKTYKNPIIQYKVQEFIANKPQLLQENTMVYMELNKIAAEIYLNEKKDYASAINCFRNIIEAAEEFGGDALVTVPPTWLNIVRLYLQTNDQDKALEQCVLALRFMDRPDVVQKIQHILMTNMQYKMQHVQTMGELFAIAAELYGAKGNKEMASQYQKLYQQIQMSMATMGGSPMDQMFTQAMMNAYDTNVFENLTGDKKKKKEKKKKKKKK